MTNREIATEIAYSDYCRNGVVTMEAETLVNAITAALDAKDERIQWVDVTALYKRIAELEAKKAA